MGHLQLDSVSIGYGEKTVVYDVNITHDAGNVLALLGPSGCGKTSILRAIAGLVEVKEGKIFVGDRDITQLRPQKRNVGIVFQDHLLFPYMTLVENVGYGLRSRGTHKKEALHKAQEMLELVGLGDRSLAHPTELSGGQSQRVALARALAAEPEILLLDEPFSALDVDLRGQLRREVANIIAEFKTTTVMVTHDREEAMSMADQVALVRDGRMVEYGPIRQVFSEPRHAYTARFLSRANILDLNTSQVGQAVAVRPDELQLTSAGIGARLMDVEWLGQILRTRWQVDVEGAKDKAPYMEAEFPVEEMERLPEIGSLGYFAVPDNAREVLLSEADTPIKVLFP